MFSAIHSAFFFGGLSLFFRNFFVYAIRFLFGNSFMNTIFISYGNSLDNFFETSSVIIWGVIAVASFGNSDVTRIFFGKLKFFWRFLMHLFLRPLWFYWSSPLVIYFENVFGKFLWDFLREFFLSISEFFFIILQNLLGNSYGNYFPNAFKNTFRNSLDNFFNNSFKKISDMVFGKSFGNS